MDNISIKLVVMFNYPIICSIPSTNGLEDNIFSHYQLAKFRYTHLLCTLENLEIFFVLMRFNAIVIGYVCGFVEKLNI